MATLPWLGVLGTCLLATSLASQAAAPQKHLALLVGIDRYDTAGVPNLHGAVRDVDEIAALLENRFGFAKDDLRILRNEQATRQAFVTAFHDHLLQQAGPDTQVVLFYAGHGSCIPDRTGRESNKGNAAAPHDQSLLLWDSRRDGRQGSGDLSDDQLHSLLRALERRTRHIVYLADCCHAGGNTRGATDPLTGSVRHADFGSEPVTAAALSTSQWPTDVPFLDDDAPERATPLAAVQLFACEEDQSAGEYPKERPQHGTMSWFLLQELRRAGPTTTWRQVAETVRARVAGFGSCPDQIVGWAGPVDQLVFGGGHRPPPKGFPCRLEGARLRIEFGLAHGLGTPDHFEVSTFDGHRVGATGTPEVFTHHAEAAWAKGTTPPPPAAAWRAVPVPRQSGRERLRIGGASAAAATLLRAVPWCEVVAEPPFDFLVTAVDGSLRITTPQGLYRDQVAAEPEPLADAFYRLHCWRALWQMAAEPGTLPVSLQLAPAKADECRRADTKAPPLPATQWRVQPGGVSATLRAPWLTEAADSGGVVAFEVHNRAAEPLHLTLLSIAENGAIAVIKTPADASGPLPAGQGRRLLVQLGPDPHWPLPRPMVDRYVVLATHDRCDYTPFEQPAPVATRSAGQPLPPALALALDGTRGEVHHWGAAWFDVHLVKPPQ